MNPGLGVLPDDWQRVDDSLFQTSLRQTLNAFGKKGIEDGLQAVERYYNPAGSYAGVTFLEVGPNEPFEIGAADLWAVTTLSMRVPVEVGRALLDAGPLRDTVRWGLRLLPESIPLASVSPNTLQTMERAYSAVRSQVPSPVGALTTNQWVLASKVMARKRPLMFPVRDSQVCTYLADKGMGRGPGRLGQFRRDIQVFAYLSSHPEVVGRLSDVRTAMAGQRPRWSIDWSDLRLLDVVLWMAAQRAQA